MEDGFKFYEKYGVHQVKTGYVGDLLDGKEYHSSQFGVLHYRKVIEAAARHRICIDNHEPVIPTGLQRTFPNLMTQEGVRGQEWDAWWKSSLSYRNIAFHSWVGRPDGLYTGDVSVC